MPDASRFFTEELVFVDSEDRLSLHGALFRPASPTANVPILWIHGLFASFYDNAYVALGRELAGRGYVFLSANTRGNGFGAALRNPNGPPVTGGSGWERLEESPRDVAAWVDFLAASGYRRVVVAGHGLGARKAAFYVSERQDARVVGLVAASPIVLKYPGGAPTDEERNLLATARQMVAAGRGRDLMPWPPEGCSMSAATYLDHEDPDAPFSNVFSVTGHSRSVPLTDALKIPILAFFGSLERSSDGRDRGGELGLFRHGARSSPHVSITLIRGADHWYTGRVSAVADVLAKFVMGLPAA
ncbi:MAG TPA: alpha/beta fold hydrolase [Thermoanaerobaculia bacterium]|nr:alpha/beta fold hydrolase [Thermoanaerobaculia bacterium]HQR66268.1 alpha/beta fold hydrolase [Thermoanaerobaculia bacterium]